MSFNFVAAVTVHIDFGSARKWNLILFPLFWNLSQLFHSLLLPSSRGSLLSLHFLPLKWYYLHIWGCCYFSWQTWSNWCFTQPRILHDILLPYCSGSKESACDKGDPGSIPRLGRSPGKGMSTHSSILAWKIPWTEDPGSPWSHKESDMTEQLNWTEQKDKYQ